MSQNGLQELNSLIVEHRSNTFLIIHDVRMQKDSSLFSGHLSNGDNTTNNAYIIK